MELVHHFTSVQKKKKESHQVSCSNIYLLNSPVGLGPVYRLCTDINPKVWHQTGTSVCASMQQDMMLGVRRALRSSGWSHQRSTDTSLCPRGSTAVLGTRDVSQAGCGADRSVKLLRFGVSSDITAGGFLA